MNVYYYDNYSSNYNRIGNKISEKLVNLNSNINIFYIKDNYDNKNISLNKNIVDNVEIINKYNVNKYLNSNPPDVFVSYSFRIPDIYWTLRFNKMNVHTVQVQHGLYIKNYKRNKSIIINEMPRIISYLIYAIRIMYQSSNRMSTLSYLFKKDFKIFRNHGKIDNDVLSDTVIVWGEYWKEWYKQYLNYSNKTEFIISGSLDYELLNEDENIIKNDDSVTYIAQTLIEDGRVEENNFFKFLNKLKKFSCEYNGLVYIKLHPRSRKEIYSDISKLENVILTNKFPLSDVYISHYSSLLSLCVYLNKNIIMVKFPYNSIPDEYRHMSNNIINYDEDISVNNLNYKNVDFEYYYQYKSDPHGVIAETIINNAN